MAHAAVQWDPEQEAAVAWPHSIRWDAADVMVWMGRLYAQDGETPVQGWERAKERGWTIYPVRIRGNLQ
ncbi:MAG: hypothetical protein J0I99_19725 [Devosia sp.]|uniref:hypothetical protein n=1 Tax=Devosia sp. TaxID=1871048 RepID=UPI001AC9DF3F|nr:hypothetical protein [Devosia sp.]MBN9317976.1 hypothetical protein [Devosia sp.]